VAESPRSVADIPAGGVRSSEAPRVVDIPSANLSVAVVPNLIVPVGDVPNAGLPMVDSAPGLRRVGGDRCGERRLPDPKLYTAAFRADGTVLSGATPA
jgi:hypothetical protein